MNVATKRGMRSNDDLDDLLEARMYIFSRTDIMVMVVAKILQTRVVGQCP